MSDFANYTHDLRKIFARRQQLHAEGTTIFRAVHTSETAGLFALDIAGDTGVLSLYAEQTAAQEQQLAEACAAAGGLASIYLKRRPVEAKHKANTEREYLSPPLPLWGAERPEVVAFENGVPLLIRPAADLSIGLFTDARPARAWVRANTPARVLNTFAYTCGFGLSAALGGAQVVKNVDLSRKVLSWGQENYALNNLAAPDSDFLYGDVFEWLGRLQKRGDLFDLVVLDPPSFARHGGKVWRADKDYGRLAALAAAVTAPHGQLLTLLNHAGVSPAHFERLVSGGLAEAGRTGRLLERLPLGTDYPAATHLKAWVWGLEN